MNRRWFLGALLAVPVAALAGMTMIEKAWRNVAKLSRTIQGRHYDHMILDDLVTEEHVDSDTGYQTLCDVYEERVAAAEPVFPGRYPIDPELIRRHLAELDRQYGQRLERDIRELF